MSTAIVYTSSQCPFCHQAKAFLNQKNISFTEICLDDQPELRARLSQDNGGFRTVPMIFIQGQFIGGFDDMVRLDQAGHLAPLVDSLA